MYRPISATPSPYARKLHIALAEKAIRPDHRGPVGQHYPSRYNPLQKLPILLLEDSSSVYDASFILEYLALKHPSPPLMSANIDERLAARRLEVLCDGVCDAVVLTFFERRRPLGCQSRAWLARQRRKIEGGVVGAAGG